METLQQPPQLKETITNIIANSFNSVNKGLDYKVQENQIRMSQITSPCIKKTILERDLVREKDKRIYLHDFKIVEISENQVNHDNLEVTSIGNMFHETIENGLLKTNSLISSEKQVKIKVNGKIELIGHFDLLLQNRNHLFIVDIKTTKSLNWQIENNYIPKEEHIEQINLYLRGLGLKNGVLFYIDKSSGETLETHHQYSEEMFVDTINKITSIINMEANEVTPNVSQFWLCNYCSFPGYCFPDG